ncbi:MAG TPA: hypothetical protein VMU68_14580 [Acidimicrobiales bacterium]|nr:hypothetical protein [Acidimicrobiales bacterium]
MLARPSLLRVTTHARGDSWRGRIATASSRRLSEWTGPTDSWLQAQRDITDLSRIAKNAIAYTLNKAVFLIERTGSLVESVDYDVPTADSIASANRSIQGVDKEFRTESLTLVLRIKRKSREKDRGNLIKVTATYPVG